MTDSDKGMIEEALQVLPQIGLYATQSNWLDAHRLAHIDQIALPGGTSQISETDWWNEHFSLTAQALSRLPIVKTTTRGFAPAVNSQGNELDFHADFVLPRFSLKDSDGPSLDRLWPLVVSADNVDPPEKDIASEWNQTASAWQRLGVEVSCLGLAGLVHSLRADAETLDKLRVRSEPLLWMARLIDLIGEWSKSHSALPSQLMERLLPDQAGVLRSAESISLDQGIDSVLKDLVERIGPPLRSRLLNTGLAELANANDLRAFDDGLRLIVTK